MQNELTQKNEIDEMIALSNPYANLAPTASKTFNYYRVLSFVIGTHGKFKPANDNFFCKLALVLTMIDHAYQLSPLLYIKLRKSQVGLKRVWKDFSISDLRLHNDLILDMMTYAKHSGCCLSCRYWQKSCFLLRRLSRK